MNNIEIEPIYAGLMLSAIVSDTLLFKSPTCTPIDVKAAEKLAKIANVDKYIWFRYVKSRNRFKFIYT